MTALRFGFDDMPPTTHLRLTKYGNKTDQYGLYVLHLERYDASGADLGFIKVCSGQPGSKQQFQKAADSPSGSFRPIPEGRYLLGKLEWAKGPGNYAASWGTGLGATWVSIDPAPGLFTRRGDLGVHLDANRLQGAPGSAGCITLPDRVAQEKFVSWYSDPYGPPVALTVDWGLGTVPPVKVLAVPLPGLRVVFDGKEISCKARLEDGKTRVELRAVVEALGFTLVPKTAQDTIEIRKDA